MSTHPRPWGISPPLYVPPPEPPKPRRPAVFWAIAVPLALAFAFSMMGLGYIACNYVSDLIGGM